MAADEARATHDDAKRPRTETRAAGERREVVRDARGFRVSRRGCAELRDLLGDYSAQTGAFFG